MNKRGILILLLGKTDSNVHTHTHTHTHSSHYDWLEQILRKIKQGKGIAFDTGLLSFWAGAHISSL
jgi:hypothetical protein